MQINSVTHLLDPAIESRDMLDSIRYRSSPHCDDRPSDAVIDMIVIHNISLPPGQFGTGVIEKFFCGTLDFSLYPDLSSIRELQVASHLLISREGTITQWVPFSKRAWHAGESIFQGRTRCNDFSIGIELEGTDDIPYEKNQYHRLSDVIKLLLNHYPAITRERIVGHCDIAPKRKTDPGPAFDWAYLHCLLDE